MNSVAEKWARYVVLVGTFLIPFIPLIISFSLFFPFITGKNFAFRILVELMLGAWVLLMLYNPAYRPRFSWLLAAITAFVGIIAVADIFGEHPLKSIWSNFERMEGLVTLVHLLVYFLIIGTVLNTEKLWNRLLNTSVGVSGLLGIYGLFQLLGFITINQGGVRLDATFGNATYLAIYMVFHVFITALLMIRYKSERYGYFVYGGLVALQVLMVYFTATRGAILGLLGGVLFTGLLIALFERKRKVLQKVAIGSVVAVLVLVGGFFLIKDTQFAQTSPVLSRFATLSLSSGTVDARFQVWSLAIEGVKERPLLGWGQENFNFVFNTYYKPELYAQEQWFDRVHNVVFDWLIAGGVLGFLAYVSIFLTALFYLWRKKNTFFSVPEKSVITGLFAAYTFHNLFVFDNIMSYILFFTILAFIYFSYRESTKGHYLERLNTKETGIRDTGLITRVYLPVIIIATLFMVHVINTKGVLAASTLLDALATQPGTEAQLTHFKQALSYNSFGDQEIREQIAQSASRIAGSEQVDIEIRQQYLSLARTEMQKQLHAVPNDARTQVFMGTLLDAFSQHEEALPYLERADELSPQKPTILFQLGLNAISRGDITAALDIFKNAYKLTNQSRQARIFYAVGAIYSRDAQLLEEILVPEFGSVVVDNDTLLRAYFNNQEFTRVRDIWALRVEKNPQNIQVRLGLAASLLQLNDRVGAVRELQNAIQIDPSFKEQGEFLIKEIQAGRNP